MSAASRRYVLSSGATLIEFVLVTMAVLWGILAFFDVARMFQIYFALSEAAELTARELGTLSGTGVSVSPDARQAKSIWYLYQWNHEPVPKLVKVTEVESATRPAECDAYPKCEQIPLPLASAPANKVSFDLKNAAFQKGYKELESALPLVKRDCTDPYCATFEQLDPDEKQTVTVRASYRLPLTIVFKKKIVVVSSRARHVVERELVDDNLDLDARQQ